jgi:hypothetical protein
MAKSKQLARRAPRSARERMDTISATFSTIMSELSSPALLLAMVGVSWLCLTHKANPALSVVTKVTDWLSNNTATAEIGKFLGNHKSQTLGAICYSLTTMVTAPRNKMGMWLIIGAAAAFLIPESSSYQYIVQCLAFAMYMKARRQDVKMLIILGVGALYVFGYLLPN